MLRQSISLFVAFIFVVGCNVIPHQGSIGTHTITGIVVDEKTNAPVSGAMVCARYAKLDLRYYVRGLQRTSTNGSFRIDKNPETVTLLDGPRGLIPSITISHPDYFPTGYTFKTFDNDIDLRVALKPRSPRMPDDPYISCRESAKAP